MVDGIGNKAALDGARLRLEQNAANRVSAVAPDTPVEQAKPVHPVTRESKGAELSALATASREMGAVPLIDRPKVEQIKRAIAEGRYPIVPDAIASKMIELDLGPVAKDR